MLILGFHPRDLRLDDGCYPPCWCPNKRAHSRGHSEKVSVKMVLCVVFGCGSRSDRDKGIGFYRIPSLATNKGEFEEELTTERREKWIKAISRGDTESKDVLNSERVCGKHFVSGKPAPYWHKHHVDWVPTLQLGKKNFRPKLDHDANAKRAARAKKREQLAVERQERKVAEKRGKLVESSLPVAQIDFNQANTSIEEAGNRKEGIEEAFSSHLAAIAVSEDKEIEPETLKVDAECHYMFQTSRYQAPNKDFFDTDDKVHFYTGLPSMEVLMVVFEHVFSHVTRQTQSLNRVQEFIIVLMKLRLNAPLQDLAYRFVVSVSTISRIFSHWIVAMNTRLFRFVYWPDRDHLWRTMPQCFQYAFGKKTTVVIDCFEVFIERPSNFLARAQTFSSYKHHNQNSGRDSATRNYFICV